ncbi:hypothetical protein ACGFYF_42265, partial [Streptomyces lavendulae]|uniref:hypothetical protein n=1 Tax=Streptomyces lavendulae TaxID=1914 RepID=UPI003716B988
MDLPKPVITTPAIDGVYIAPKNAEISGTAGIGNDKKAVVRVFWGETDVSSDPGAVVDGKWTVYLSNQLPAGDHELKAYVYVDADRGSASDTRKVRVVALPVPVISLPAENSWVVPGASISGTAAGVPDDAHASVQVLDVSDYPPTGLSAEVKDGKWETKLLNRSGVRELLAQVWIGSGYGPSSDVHHVRVVGAPVVTVPASDGAYIAQGGEISGTAEIPDDANAVVKIFDGDTEVSQEPDVKVAGRSWTARLTKTISAGEHSLSAFAYLGKDRGPASSVRKVSVVALPAPMITVPASDDAYIAQGGAISGTAEIADTASAVVRVFAGDKEVSAEPGKVLGNAWSVRLKPDVAVGEQELKAFVYLGDVYGPASEVRRLRVAGPVKLGMTSQLSAASVVAGGAPVTFSWTVVNKGPSVAERLVVSAAFPPGVVLDLSSVKPVAQEGGNNALQWLAVGDLQPGQSVTVSVAAVMAPRLPASRVEPVAWVSADNPDADHLEIQAAVGPVAAPVDVQARVKLAFAGGKAVPAEVVAGTSGPVDVVYSWSLENAGPSDAGLVTVRATVPDGAVLKAGQEGWILTEGKSAVRVFDSLPVHGSVPVSVVASVPTQGAEEPVTVTVEANAATADKDTGQPARAQGSASARRVSRAALTLVSPDPVTVVAGEPTQVNFVWSLANAGPSAARQLTLRVQAPAGMQFGESAGWTLSEGSTVAGRVIESLAAAASVDLTLAGVVRLKADTVASEGPLLTVRSVTPDANTPAQLASASKAATVKVTSRAVLEIAEARAFPVEVRPG